MIIERKYVTLKKLYMTDLKSKAVLDEAFARAGFRNISDSDVWSKNARTTVFNADMGCCLPQFGFICESFAELDKIDPYDNGKTVRDIVSANVLGWKADGSIVLLLCDRNGNIISLSETIPIDSQKVAWRESEGIVYNPNVIF